MVEAPLGDGSLVFAEHSLARAGHVGEYQVERHAALAEGGGVVVGDVHVGSTPFLDVLSQNLCPLAVGLVAHQYAVGTDGRSQQGGFSTGCCAEVECRDGALVADVLPQHFVEKHR